MWRTYPDREKLARELAAGVAARLAAAIGQRGRAVLVVSGGSTPGLFFDLLSQQEIAWNQVTITLADERFVPPDHARSNERLVRQRLLRNQAAAARMLGLYGDAGEPGEAARQASRRIIEEATPFDVVVLGVGLDGHTASIFPDADTLAGLIADEATLPVMPVRAATADEPRLSLALAWLLRAPHIILHMEGQEKRALIEACLSGRIEPKPPIAHVFAKARGPVEIYWAPAGDTA